MLLELVSGLAWNLLFVVLFCVFFQVDFHRQGFYFRVIVEYIFELVLEFEKFLFGIIHSEILYFDIIQSNPINGVLLAFAISSGNWSVVMFVFTVVVVWPRQSILLSFTSL